MECFLSCLWDGRNVLPCGTQGLDKKPSIACHIFKPVCLGDKPRLPCRGATLQLPLLRDRPRETRSDGSLHAGARERPCWLWGQRWGFGAPVCDAAGKCVIQSYRGAFLLRQGHLNLCTHYPAAPTAVTGMQPLPSWETWGTVPRLVFLHSGLTLG